MHLKPFIASIVMALSTSFAAADGDTEGTSPIQVEEASPSTSALTTYLPIGVIESTFGDDAGERCHPQSPVQMSVWQVPAKEIPEEACDHENRIPESEQ